MSFLAPEPMLEVNLFLLEPDLEVVTAALAGMEVFQVEEAVPEGWIPSAEWVELANRYGNLTSRMSDIFQGLGTRDNVETFAAALLVALLALAVDGLMAAASRAVSPRGLTTRAGEVRSRSGRTLTTGGQS